MITPPPTWVRYSGAHLLRLEPPDGRGRITYHERVAPRRFRDVVDGLLAEDPSFAVEDRGAIERLVTAEGEHAAWIALTARSARRWIGAVLLDDSLAVLDGQSFEERLDPLLLGTTRWLLVNASFGLGTRRRRFQYVPPAGWWGVPAGLSTTWYPPGFPGRRSMLVVPPAEPCWESAAAAFAELLDDDVRRSFTLTGAVHEQRMATGDGLAGVCFRYRGRWLHDASLLDNHIVLLTDGCYRYALRLEAVGDVTAAEASALSQLALTVVGVPRRGQSGPVAPSRLAELFVSWIG